MKKQTFQVNAEDFFSKAVAFCDESLSAYKVDPTLKVQTMFLAEEMMIQLKEHMPEDAAMTVRVRKALGAPRIELSAKGEAFDALSAAGNAFLDEETRDEDMEDAIHAVILQSYGDKLKYRNKDGVNRILVSAGKSGKKTLFYTLGALVLAVLVGFLFRMAAPANVNDILCGYVFTPFKTMFINALKIIVGPVVFFSIATCISQFKNLSELGRIGAKVMGMYLFTTLIAILVGIGMFTLLSPGTFGMAAGMETAAVSVNMEADTSILGTIIGIVPSNFLKPFVEANTLQIIFLGVLCGVAVGLIGDYAKILKDFFEACNSLFLAITAMISSLIPLAVFSAVFLMVVQTGSESLLAMLHMTVTEFAAVGCMIVFYGLLVLLLGRLNPLTFFKKNLPGMLTSFSLSSSNAAMPANMAICENSLGISKKIFSFSIPLGATVNMDGTSIHLAISALFLAKMYGVEVPASSMLSIVITIIMLSVGTPGVPGASLVCLGVLLNQIGVPVEAIGIIMGVDALLDMLRTMSNTTGDMAVTLTVANSEKLVDLEVFHRK
ncbi:MAG: dicarboxylate/amino acid:cation symporter [Lachnospiraceae bacterium]|nr:dicarboxylate/amino acid:cation symporter [Lachnospiraceae bacterium]